MQRGIKTALVVTSLTAALAATVMMLVTWGLAMNRYNISYVYVPVNTEYGDVDMARVDVNAFVSGLSCRTTLPPCDVCFESHTTHKSFESAIEDLEVLDRDNVYGTAKSLDFWIYIVCVVVTVSTVSLSFRGQGESSKVKTAIAMTVLFAFPVVPIAIAFTYVTSGLDHSATGMTVGGWMSTCRRQASSSCSGCVMTMNLTLVQNSVSILWREVTRVAAGGYTKQIDALAWTAFGVLIFAITFGIIAILTWTFPDNTVAATAAAEEEESTKTEYSVSRVSVGEEDSLVPQQPQRLEIEFQ